MPCATASASNSFSSPLIGVLLVSLLVLAAELGGVCLAFQLLTGIGFPWWALPIGLAAWLLVWKGTFSVIEKGTSLFGLITVAFLVAAVMAKPDWRAVLAGARCPACPGKMGPTTGFWLSALSAAPP